MNIKPPLTLITIITVFLLSACMTYKADWRQFPRERPSSDSASLLKEAYEKEASADTRDSLADTISSYEDVLKADPENYLALTALGNLYMLLGDGYGATVGEKKEFYMKSLHYNERAMYTNSEFRQLVDDGEEVWEAVRALGGREMGPMLFWTMSVFYYYKDVHGFWGQVLNVRWIDRAKAVMERMYEIAPDYGNGAIHLTWGLYYLAIPEVIGGDREKSRELFAKAVDTGPNMILNRWARAKYFHVKMKNRQEFVKDLHWVIGQDTRETYDSYPWKAFFIQDAQRLMQNIDAYFPSSVDG